MLCLLNWNVELELGAREHEVILTIKQVPRYLGSTDDKIADRGLAPLTWNLTVSRP